MFHFDLSLEKGLWLAETLNADTDIVSAGIALMDLKLGEAAKKGMQNQHVNISLEATISFLEQYNVEQSVKDTLINAVSAHHGAIAFSSIESEICANADCYRFVHPKGVFFYFTTLSKRLGDFNAVINQIEIKLKEKINIASIPAVKKELFEYYKVFEHYIELSR